MYFRGKYNAGNANLQKYHIQYFSAFLLNALRALCRPFHPPSQLNSHNDGVEILHKIPIGLGPARKTLPNHHAEGPHIRFLGKLKTSVNFN